MINKSFENRAKEFIVNKIPNASLIEAFRNEDNVAMKKFLLLKLASENNLNTSNELVDLIAKETNSITEAEIKNVLAWSLK